MSVPPLFKKKLVNVNREGVCQPARNPMSRR